MKTYPITVSVQHLRDIGACERLDAALAIIRWDGADTVDLSAALIAGVEFRDVIWVLARIGHVDIIRAWAVDCAAYAVETARKAPQSSVSMRALDKADGVIATLRRGDTPSQTERQELRDAAAAAYAAAAAAAYAAAAYDAAADAADAADARQECKSWCKQRLIERLTGE